MNDRKIYVSLPIEGYEETLEQRCYRASHVAMALGYVPVTPLDINKSNMYTKDGELIPYKERLATCIGNDIRELLKCDAILMCENWDHSNSKGCRVEKFTAEVYGIPVIYELDNI